MIPVTVIIHLHKVHKEHQYMGFWPEEEVYLNLFLEELIPTKVGEVSANI